MDVTLGETVYLPFATHSPTTGALTSADATPTVQVIRNGVSTTLGASVSVLSGAQYLATIVVASSDSYTADMCCGVLISAIISTVSGCGNIGNFMIRSANVGDLPLASVYTSTRAGYLDNLDAAISTRSTISTADVWADTVRTLTSHGTIEATITTNLDAAISSRAAASAYTTTRGDKLDYLDAAITSRSTASASEVWSETVRTLTSHGTIEATITTNLDAAISSRAAASAYTTARGDKLDYLDAAISSIGTTAISDAVWAGTARTLTSFGTLTLSTSAGDSIGDSVWNVPTSNWDTAKTAGTYVLTRLAGDFVVTCPGPDDDDVISIVPGDEYVLTHDTQIEVAIPSAPDLTGATLAFTVDGTTFDSSIVPTVTGASTSRVCNIELLASESAELSILPTGTPEGTAARYWRVKATWTSTSDGAIYTIATGEIRRVEGST